VLLATWDHTVLPATRHKRTHHALTPASEGWYSIYLPEGMEGWVDLGGWLHTEMVYPPADVTHPSTNRARRRVTTLIETNALPLCQATTVSGCLEQIIRPTR